MSKKLRVKCSCGECANALPGQVCMKCHRPLEFTDEGMIVLYRKGSPLGIIGGFGIYLNNVPYGYIANRETVKIPLKYGKYNLHIAVGMNRRCTDYIIELTPENRVACMKVWMKPGFISNTFVLEPATPDEMPE